jgi:hypothetical protein
LLPSWFHIVMAIRAVKLPAITPQDRQRAPSVPWRAGRGTKHLSKSRTNEAGLGDMSPLQNERGRQLRRPYASNVPVDRAHEMKSLLFAAPILLSACSDQFTEAQLVGDYVANYGGETATLSLKADHTYTHTFQYEGSGTPETGSTWQSSDVTSRPPQTVVEFSNFRVIPSFKDAHGQGWSTEVDRTWFGQIRLCYDSDVGYCYVKKANP